MVVRTFSVELSYPNGEVCPRTGMSCGFREGGVAGGGEIGIILEISSSSLSLGSSGFSSGREGEGSIVETEGDLKEDY